MSVRLVEMAKLVLLLVLVCFQFSFQEELEKPQFELINDEIPLNDVQLLDGEDKNQWHYQKDDDDVKPLEEVEENEWKYEKEDDVDDDSDWTESDEEWLELLGELLEDSDEDYDDDSEEFNKLIEEIDKFLQEKYPDDDKWLDEADDDDWEDILSKFPDFAKPGKQGDSGKSSLNVYYSWLLRMKESNSNKKQISKRFSSV